MTADRYDEAWWRSYVVPIADRAVLTSAEEIVLDAVREYMTADEIRAANTLIEAQWVKLGGRAKDAAA